jgi:predicted RND superfamily exporter protein
MLRQLGKLIEKHPWLVIALVLLITVGFATLIPSIEMKTEFEDFMPDDEVVEASMRILDYYGEGTLSMFLYVTKEQSESTINVEALKEQYNIGEEILELRDVKDTISITTLVDQICQLEFGEPMANCTDEQISIAINDILGNHEISTLKLFDNDDENEDIDYKRYPRISRGKSIDEIDIKNCYISYNNDTIDFSIEVYDLSSFESETKSPIFWANVVEWYIDFENLIKPDERLDMSYKISAHLEPKHELWEVGRGVIKNIVEILNNIKNRELFNSYDKEAYLWIRPPDQTMYLPLQLETAEIDFNTNKNLITITVSREEIGKYGIAPRFGIFELPAKLTNFKAGTRYYETPIVKLPWFRVTANTSYIFEKLKQIQDRPLLSNIAGRLLERHADMTWEDFDMIFDLMDENLPLPDQVALKDIESSWVNADLISENDISENILFIKSYLFDDLKISAKGFLSKDYEINQKPKSSLIIVSLNTSGDYNEIIESTEYLLNEIEKIDAKRSSVSLEVTGDGVISYEMDKVTMEANQIIMPLIFIVILTILFISFRKLSYVLLPMFALIVSTIWLFGTMVILGIAFTTIAVAIVPLIMGLGVDYSVHLSHNYRIELSKGRTPAEAIKKSILEIGTAMFLAMITTVIAFLSFLSATLPPIRDFGILLALGIIYTFITAITLQASVRYVVDRKKKKFKNRKKHDFRLNEFMGIFSRKVLKHQKKIIAILLLITIICAFGGSQIKTGFNFDSFIPTDNEAIKIYEKIEENFPFAGQDQEYILIEGSVSTVEFLEGMMRTHENIEDDQFIGRRADGTAKGNSIYKIINQAVNSNLSLIEKFNLNENTKIPETDQDVKAIYDYLWDSDEYGYQTKNNVYRDENDEYKSALIRVYIDILSEGRESADLEADLKIMSDELDEDFESYGRDTEAIVTGQFIIMHRITSSLTESQFLSTMISLILATIVLVIAYRRPTLALIAMIPVMISIIWILGTMYFVGYSLDILTITVTSLTIGIGIDYAIHATERFRLVADKTGDITAAVVETISKTGGALLIAALTTALGFGMLVFAPIPPQVKFGVITAMTITYSLITSVLLLPLILARWAKWSKKRKGYIISTKPAEEEYLNDVHENEK